MKINYGKKKLNGQTDGLPRHDILQSYKLKVAETLSPHAFSVGPTICPEECDDMTVRVRACFPC